MTIACRNSLINSSSVGAGGEKARGGGVRGGRRGKERENEEEGEEVEGTLKTHVN